MTQNGCVLLGVDSPDSLRMAQALSAMLPGADAYYAQQRPEQQHLTLGRFGGSDAAGFAAWLSDSLAGQNSLLPTFTGSHVQLSDEARPFPNHPIPLGRRTRAAGAGAFGGLGNGGLGGGLGNGGLGGGFGTVGGGFDAPIGGGGRGPIGAAPIGAIGAAPIGGGAVGGSRQSARGGRWARPPRPPRPPRRRRRPAGRAHRRRRRRRSRPRTPRRCACRLRRRRRLGRYAAAGASW